MIHRRVFLTSLAAGALAAPRPGWAPRPAVPRVGYLTAGSARPNSEGFEQGLKEAGYIPGQSASSSTGRPREGWSVSRLSPTKSVS